MNVVVSGGPYNFRNVLGNSAWKATVKYILHTSDHLLE